MPLSDSTNLSSRVFFIGSYPALPTCVIGPACIAQVWDHLKWWGPIFLRMGLSCEESLWKLKCTVAPAASAGSENLCCQLQQWVGLPGNTFISGSVILFALSLSLGNLSPLFHESLEVRCFTLLTSRVRKVNSYPNYIGGSDCNSFTTCAS